MQCVIGARACVFFALLCVCFCVTPPYKRASFVPEFLPDHSSSFRFIPLKVGGVNVDYKYADGSALIGFDGQDIVSLGNYNCVSRIAGIRKANSGDFNEVSGILGFGFTEHPRNPSLLYTMSTRSRPDWNLTQPASMHLLPHRVFAVLSNSTHGELQLNGYDPLAAAAPVHYVSMPTIYGYGVAVTSIQYGGVEVLNFAPGYSNFTAILDSGTTCFVFPNTTVNGTFTESPYNLFEAASSKAKAPMIITLEGGYKLEFPYSAWHDESCVVTLDIGFLLGNLLFRHYLTVFDVDRLQAGFAPINPKYVLGRRDGLSLETGQNWMSSVVVDPETSMKRRVTKAALLNVRRSQFHIEITVGTPPQPLNVIFDTGSYMLAIFSKAPSKTTRRLGQHSSTSTLWGDLRWVLLGLLAIGSIVGIVLLKGTIASHRRKVKEALFSESKKKAAKMTDKNEVPEWMVGYGTY